MDCYLALRGLKMLLDTVDSVRQVTNPSLRVLGMLATTYASGSPHLGRFAEQGTPDADRDRTVQHGRLGLHPSPGQPRASPIRQ